TGNNVISGVFNTLFKQSNSHKNGETPTNERLTNKEEENPDNDDDIDTDLPWSWDPFVDEDPRNGNEKPKYEDATTTTTPRMSTRYTWNWSQWKRPSDSKDSIENETPQGMFNGGLVGIEEKTPIREKIPERQEQLLEDGNNILSGDSNDKIDAGSSNEDRFANKPEELPEDDSESNDDLPWSWDPFVDEDPRKKQSSETEGSIETEQSPRTRNTISEERGNIGDWPDTNVINSVFNSLFKSSDSKNENDRVDESVHTNQEQLKGSETYNSDDASNEKINNMNDFNEFSPNTNGWLLYDDNATSSNGKEIDSTGISPTTENINSDIISENSMDHSTTKTNVIDEQFDGKQNEDSLFNNIIKSIFQTDISKYRNIQNKTNHATDAKTNNENQKSSTERYITVEEDQTSTNVNLGHVISQTTLTGNILTTNSENKDISNENDQMHNKANDHKTNIISETDE
ncbi:unnamed protein product, partial [Owenia fusiformis]